MTDWTDEDALGLDIAMALSKIKTKPQGDRDGIHRKMVAEQIVVHLLLLRRRLETKPPHPAVPAFSRLSRIVETVSLHRRANGAPQPRLLRD
jgi:hypothetical protein